MNIATDGLITVLASTGSQSWEQSIAPGDMDNAALYLTDDEMQQATAAWTPELVAAWQAANPSYTTAPPPPPTLADRIAILESKVTALEATA